MRRTAGAVVVGGGVNGCSIAYHLTRSGCDDVVVVEKGEIAGGASGRCPGGFRHQWGTEDDIRLMSASIAMLVRLREELESPGDLEIRQYGYLLLADSEEEMEQFRTNVALQLSLGIPVELLDGNHIGDVAPGLNAEGLPGGAYCRWDGRASPYLVTHAYAAAARRLGAQIHTGVRVTGVTTAGGRVTAVVTDQGTIETSKVVCVAGAASKEIARMVGVDVPITPVRRHMLITQTFPRPAWPAVLSHQVVSFQTPGGEAVYAGGSGDPDDGAVTDMDSLGFYVRTLRAMAELMPVYRHTRILRLWAGTYDMTPDAHPVVGEMPEVEGFFMAAGFSGHGFMMSPIVGKVMADLVTGQPPVADISALDPRRFQGGRQVVEKMVY